MMVKHHNLHEHKAGDTKRLNNYKVERLRCNRSDPYSRSPGPRSDVHGRVSNPGPPGPVIWDLFLQLPVGVAIGFPPCHLLGTPNTKHPNHLSRLGGRGTDNSVTIRCARGKKKDQHRGDRDSCRSSGPFLAALGGFDDETGRVSKTGCVLSNRILPCACRIENKRSDDMERLHWRCLCVGRRLSCRSFPNWPHHGGQSVGITCLCKIWVGVRTGNIVSWTNRVRVRDPLSYPPRRPFG